MDEDSAVLVCTVGGSHQPVLTALKARHWQRVVFVCSAATPESRSSATMITDAVEIAGSEARPGQRLPPIPEHARLRPGSWEIVEVLPDDPDRAFGKLLDRLQRLKSEGAPIVADYTGGTKSMSAALFLAALHVGAEIQLVTGQRVDLIRVTDLTERETTVRTLRVAARSEFQRLATGWSRYAYQEAAEGFDRLRSDLNEARLGRDELARFNRAQELSSAFAAWDRFDHKAAAGCLRRYKEREIGGRSDWFELASTLGGNAPWSALHLRDLWHNAQRCAVRGRYDDAIARLYRLWEAIAQWLLRVDFRIDTKVIKTGLKTSWELYLHLRGEGSPAEFWRRRAQVGGIDGSEIELIEKRLSLRNQSILAHGWNTISESGWKTLSGWTKTGLLDMLASEAERLGEPHELPQLPTALPAL